jgi:hypothetical protein
MTDLARSEPAPGCSSLSFCVKHYGIKDGDLVDGLKIATTESTAASSSWTEPRR